MPRPLTTELAHHIIKLALPIVSYGTYRERYDLLLAFSLVNSAWSALAREELYKEVFVETGEELAAVLDGKEDQARRHVRLGSGQGSRFYLHGSSTALGSVKHLSISSMCINAKDWPAFQELETLHICSVFLVAAAPANLPSGSLFRSLTTLSLIDVRLTEGFPTWSTWCTPSNLPHLSRLAVCLLKEFTFGADDDIVKALETLAPQIQTLTVSGQLYLGSFVRSVPWSAFAAVRRLALYLLGPADQGTLSDAVLGQLPATASLSHLTVGYSNGAWGDFPGDVDVWEHDAIPALLSAVDSDLACLRQLTTLVMHLEDKVIKEETRESTRRLSQAMGARGGRLEQRVGWGEREGLLNWERYLDVW